VAKNGWENWRREEENEEPCVEGLVSVEEMGSWVLSHQGEGEGVSQAAWEADDTYLGLRRNNSRLEGGWLLASYSMSQGEGWLAKSCNKCRQLLLSGS
jgi:hypothetical protein